MAGVVVRGVRFGVRGMCVRVSIVYVYMCMGAGTCYHMLCAHEYNYFLQQQKITFLEVLIEPLVTEWRLRMHFRRTHVPP